MCRSSLLVAFIVLLIMLGSARAQPGDITYQGSLQISGNPASGAYDFEFGLFSVLTGGTEITSHTAANVTVTDGVFKVTLPFGDHFLTGAQRYLEIRVRPFNVGSFTTLTPRQQITSSPYSIRSISAQNAANATNAATATNALQLGGVAANQYVLTGDPRLSDARQPSPNSPNYIQNTTSQQATSNFNISGTGVIGGSFSVGGPPSGASRVTITHPGALENGLFVQNTASGTEGGTAIRATSANIPGEGIGGHFTGGRAAILAVGSPGGFNGSAWGIHGSVSGNNGTRFGVSGVSSATTGAVASYGVHGQATGTAAVNYGVFGTAFGGSTNWAGYFDGNARVTGDLTVNGTLNATLPSGSPNYIQNSAIQQPGDFNIAGIGRANRFDAVDRYDLNGMRLMTASSIGTTIVGYNAGQQNPLGVSSATEGEPIPGSSNSFFGAEAGRLNSTGHRNTFIGFESGEGNTSGGNNSFLGALSGAQNSTGSFNTFYGGASGYGNTSGSLNTFVGLSSGINSNTGNENTFVGNGTGFPGASGGSNNTLLGSRASLVTNLNNATAIGYRASVACSNCMVLGSVNGENGAMSDARIGIGTSSPTFDLSFGGNGHRTIGTERSSSFSLGRDLTLQAGGPMVGSTNARGGSLTLRPGISTGSAGSFINFQTPVPGASGTTDNTGWALRMTIRENGDVWFPTSNVGIGSGSVAPSNLLNVIGTGSTAGGAVGFNEVVARFKQSTASTTHTALSVDALPNQDSILYLSKDGNAVWGLRNDASSGDKFQIRSQSTTRFNIDLTGNVGIATTTPTERLHVAGNGLFTGNVFAQGNVGIGTTNPLDELHVVGNIRLSSLGSANTTTVLCRNTALQIATCNSSSRRYKFNINDFGSGLDLVRRLRPVTFNWKQGGALDLGLVAEEVAEIEPLLATYNDDGRIEGVKYDRIGVVLVNAIKEQQEQIDTQERLIQRQAEVIRYQNEKLKQQQTDLDELKRWMCTQDPAAHSCRRNDR